MSIAYEAWFATGLDATIKASVLLLAAAVATIAMRKASAAARRAVWLLAAVGTLVVPIVSIALPGWNVLPAWMSVREARQAADVRVVETRAVKTPVSQTPHEERSPVLVESNEPDRAEPASSAHPSEPAPARSIQPVIAPPTKVQSHIDWRKWAWIAWLTGALLALLPPVVGTLSLWRLGRLSQRLKSGAIFDLVAHHSDRPISSSVFANRRFRDSSPRRSPSS